MTWEQFTDLLAIVLPIVTLILGFAGSRLSDQWREDKDRERIVVQRAADVEGEALLKLQDLFVRMPTKWDDAINYINAAVRSEIDPPPHEAYTIVSEPRQMQIDAVTLASRIVDDDVRTKVRTALDDLSIDYRAAQESVKAMKPVDDYDLAAAWETAVQANEAIGARLRAASGK
jgi:hypothetical protein